MELQRSVVAEICALCQNFLNHPRIILYDVLKMGRAQAVVIRPGRYKEGRYKES